MDKLTDASPIAWVLPWSSLLSVTINSVEWSPAGPSCPRPDKASLHILSSVSAAVCASKSRSGVDEIIRLVPLL